MTVLKILKSLWLKIRPYTSKRCCAVFLFIWDLLIQNPLQFLRNLNTGELWLQKSRKIALFCPFWLFSQTNKTNRTAAHKFKSLLLRQIRTQNRIQLFVPILRFLLLFRGIFALSRHKKRIFDKRSPSSERFCTFGGWAFLLALKLWVIIKIMVIVKIIVCGRYLVLKMCLFYAII